MRGEFRVDNGLLKSLNRLRIALDDTVRELELAVCQSHSFASYAEFGRDVDMRRTIIQRLDAIIERLGGRHCDRSSIAGLMRRIALHFASRMLDNEQLVIRHLAREERRLIDSIRLLAAAEHVPEDIRRELHSILRYLHEELCRLEMMRRVPGSAAYIAR